MNSVILFVYNQPGALFDLSAWLFSYHVFLALWLLDFPAFPFPLSSLNSLVVQMIYYFLKALLVTRKLIFPLNVYVWICWLLEVGPLVSLRLIICHYV